MGNDRENMVTSEQRSSKLAVIGHADFTITSSIDAVGLTRHTNTSTTLILKFKKIRSCSTRTLKKCAK